MTKQDIIDYIMETPGNTNPAILNQFLDEIGSGGGGGSSDFTTATVTVSTSKEALFIGAIAHDDTTDSLSVGSIAVGTLNPLDSFTAILYKGQAFFEVQSNGGSPISVTVSGNITEIQPYMYMVTGDCTITIS